MKPWFNTPLVICTVLSGSFSNTEAAIPSVSRIAVYGDSITAQGTDPDSGSSPAGGVGSYYLKAKGWQNWLRIATECGFDFVANGTSLSFSEPGKATPYLMQTYLPALLSSGATVMIDQAGINDIGQGIPLETTIADCRSTWAQCRAAGVMPIRMKVTPQTLFALDNEGGEVSARIAQLNQALRNACDQDGVPFLENNLEIEPDSGIGDPEYFTPDPTPAVHPNALGAQRLGDEMAPALLKILKPENSGIAHANWLTPNVRFDGADGGSPSEWEISPPPGTAVISQKLSKTEDGDYWDIEFDDTTGSTGLQLTNYYGNLVPPAGKALELSIKFQVLSGEITRFELHSGNSGGTGFSYAFQMPWIDGGFESYVTPDSGVLTIKGVPFIASAETATVFPIFNFNSTPGVPTTVRIWPDSFGLQLVSAPSGSGEPAARIQKAEVGQLEIHYSGILQSSGNLSSFEDVAGAVSPYQIPASGESRQFFRARQP